jgi:F-type H+-transporting ATPase subunit epsilon
MDTMKLTLVTPEATFFSGEATMVEAPGTLGEFGAYTGHMPFISTLKPGVVRIHDAKEAVSRIFVSGGIAEINPTSCTILAERVVDLTQLSRADAESRVAKAKAALDSAVEENAIFEATREAELAEAILLAVA